MLSRPRPEILLALPLVAATQLVHCRAEPPSGVFACLSDVQCPPTLVCAKDRLCRRLNELIDGVDAAPPSNPGMRPGVDSERTGDTMREAASGTGGREASAAGGTPSSEPAKSAGAAGTETRAAGSGEGSGSGGRGGAPSQAPDDTRWPTGNRFAAWPMPDAVPGARTQPSYDTTSRDTVTDNVTNLTWQRRLPAVYEGCTQQYVAGSGSAGDACSLEEARQYCMGSSVPKNYGGAGWRLPTKIELESIVDETRSPALDPIAFPDAPSDFFATASPYLGDAGTAWFVNFLNGTSYHYRVEKPARVRCVRSSSVGATSQHFDVAQDTVQDLSTGLTWERTYPPPDGSRMWEPARMYCETLTLAGGGWRLPALKELLTLIDPERIQPAIDPTAFPHTPAGTFWTASPLMNFESSHWQISFDSGASMDRGQTAAAFVKCVR